MQKVRF